MGIAVITGSGNTIGGTTSAARNVISNNGEGMEINTDNNVVQGNYIGTDASGLLDRGNRTDDGVEIRSGAGSNLIGGTAPGAGNLVAFNAGQGDNVMGGTGNAVLGNEAHSNSLLAVNLGATGVTANDTGDGDTGANDLQNFPVLETAFRDGSGEVVVDGRLDSTAGQTFRIEFFASSDADGSGHGEDETFLGAATATTDGSGTAIFSASLSAAVPEGLYITATATVDNGDGTYGSTSEFAKNVVAISDSGAALTVGTTSDVTDGDTTSISTLLADKGSDGVVSLREAIAAANNTTGTDTIAFDIGGGGLQTISPTAALDPITDPMILDATTQPGYSGTLLIELYGFAAIDATAGLMLQTNDSVIRGFSVHSFGDEGIEINGVEGPGQNNLIEANWIGIDANGAAAGNADYGLMITEGPQATALRATSSPATPTPRLSSATPAATTTCLSAT